MTRSAHQPSNQPGMSKGGGGGMEGEGDDDEAKQRERKERERGIRRDRGGERRVRAGKSVLPSNKLALMAWTALTFNH